MQQPPKSSKIVSVTVIAMILVTAAAAYLVVTKKKDRLERVKEEQRMHSRMGRSAGESLTGKIIKKGPEFSLDSCWGGKLSNEDLLGKVWVAEFIFTNCGGICPQMSDMTKRLQNQTKDLENLTIVSFTVDPKRDTLTALKEYAEEYQAQDGRWHFLRGSPEEIQEIGRHGFMLLNDEDALMHSPKAALVDQEGNIRGYFDGAGPERTRDFKEMEAEIRRLLAEAKP